MGRVPMKRLMNQLVVQRLIGGNRALLSRPLPGVPSAPTLFQMFGMVDRRATISTQRSMLAPSRLSSCVPGR